MEKISLISGIDSENYVEVAEETMKSLKGKGLTTSKIRNILALISQVYNDVVLENEELSGEASNRIKYLKVRVVYEYGREEANSKREMERNGVDAHPLQLFIKSGKIIECVDAIGRSKRKFILFNKYVEALVAYHKYFGGND